MNAEIQIFKNAKFGEVRTMTDEKGEPWFVGKDVAEVLGYSNASKAVMSHVDDDDKVSVMIEAHSQNGNLSQTKTTMINESGLYALILSSKLPQAKEFKRWVTSEVLPQIRKTGGYIPVEKEDDEKTILAKAVKILMKTVEEQKSLVQFANAVTSCEDSILIRDLAKLITQNGVKIGQSRLFYWMRLKGYLFKHETRPKQEWVEAGLFDTTIRLVQTHHGTMERCTTKVTGKGQRYFIDGFLSGRFRAENGEFK